MKTLISQNTALVLCQAGRQAWLWVAALTVAIVFCPVSAKSQTMPSAPNILVLFDNSGEFAWLARMYSVKLQNLLAHFDAKVIRKDTELKKEYWDSGLSRVETGGQILQQGTTHQFDNLLNSYTGVSGDEYEFYRVTVNASGVISYVGPVPNASLTWARNRLLRGQNILNSVGFHFHRYPNPAYLAQTVNGIKSLGYEFVAVDGATKSSKQTKAQRSPSSCFNKQPSAARW